MPDGTFDVALVAEGTGVDAEDVVGLLGAGARYGVTDDLEVSIALIRLLIKSAEAPTLLRGRRYPRVHHVAPARNSDLDAPVLGVALRLFDGPVSLAARLESELPIQSEVEVGASLPVVVRLGRFVRVDLLPLLVVVLGDIDRSAASVAMEFGVQPASRLFLAARAAADFDRFGAALRPGGRVTWTFGRPGSASIEVGLMAQADLPLSGGLDRPAAGNPASAQLVIRGFFDDD